MNILLIGPPGSFVCEVGEALSTRLNIPMGSTQAVLEEIEESHAPQEFSAQERKNLEREVTLAALAQIENTPDSSHILALNSRALGSQREEETFAHVRERISALTRSGVPLIYLSADLPTLMKRTGVAGASLPALGSPRRTFILQLAAYTAVYEAFATHHLSTTGLEVAEVTRKILEILHLDERRGS